MRTTIMLALVVVLMAACSSRSNASACRTYNHVLTHSRGMRYLQIVASLKSAAGQAQQPKLRSDLQALRSTYLVGGNIIAAGRVAIVDCRSLGFPMKRGTGRG